mmetsp:Transcript_40527/g.72893  ORF Transcript_40527/g.72893 Transcript_40527/m.72893 type:complete len:253 (+) Transcript_40527:265-1023(+)
MQSRFLNLPGVARSGRSSLRLLQASSESEPSEEAVDLRDARSFAFAAIASIPTESRGAPSRERLAPRGAAPAECPVMLKRGLKCLPKGKTDSASSWAAWMLLAASGSCSGRRSSKAPVIALKVIRRLFLRCSSERSAGVSGTGNRGDDGACPNSGVAGCGQPSLLPSSCLPKVGSMAAPEAPARIFEATSGLSSTACKAQCRCAILACNDALAPELFSACASAARRRSAQWARRCWISSFSACVSCRDCKPA